MPHTIAMTYPQVSDARDAGAGWKARLSLGYRHANGRTVLYHNQHDGPLRVQKALYPEGDAVSHALIVHPPGGVAGGDALAIDLALGRESQVLTTTPGATKWYRSNGASASQRVAIAVGEGGAIEWLPQETIVFNGAMASLETTVTLAEGACFLGWEILCLGRAAAGEKFESGKVYLRTTICEDAKPIWIEQSRLLGGGRALHSPAGLDGATVSGVMLATGVVSDEVLSRCRDVSATAPGTGITRLPELLVARYVGHSSERARAYFVALWRELRPVLLGRGVTLPRIWST